MSPVRGIIDVPTDVLCDIVQRCCGDDIYKLATLRAVSKTLRASVDVISLSLIVADLRFKRSHNVLKGTLEQCKNLIAILLISCPFQSIPDLKVFTYTANTLCILQMHHCQLTHGVMPVLGRTLPHLQGLSLCSSLFHDANSPWEGFPQLKLLRVDWTQNTTSRAFEPLRSQLLYFSCHGCTEIGDSVCEGLDSCVALDLAHTPISDAGLQILLDEGAPWLKLLFLNTKSHNLWDEGSWTTAMAERVEQRGIHVIQSAGYGTNRAAVEECLREAYRDRPQVLKYAAEYVL